MGPPRPKLMSKKGSSPHSSRDPDPHMRVVTDMHMRGADERRSKNKHDTWGFKDKAVAQSPTPPPRNQDMRAVKGKGVVRSQTPPLKKRKVLEVQSQWSSDQEGPLGRHEEVQDDDSDDVSYDIEAAEEQEDDSDDSEDEDVTEPPRRRRSKKDEEKKPIKLDVLGRPYGRMMQVLAEDVKRFSKDLDPSTSWEGQPPDQKRRFFKRVYRDWEMKGEAYKLSPKWVSPIATKVLISTRWRLNGLIDQGKGRPAKVNPDQWDALVRNRASPASKKMSEHMRAISTGKGSKLTILRVMEMDAISSLSIQLGRKPKQEEISAEVAKEFNRQEELRRNAPGSRSHDIQEITGQVVEMESAVGRLEGKMDSSIGRLEGMLRDFLVSGAGKAITIARHVASSSKSVPMKDVLALKPAPVHGTVDPLLGSISAIVEEANINSIPDEVNGTVADEVEVEVEGTDNGTDVAILVDNKFVALEKETATDKVLEAVIGIGGEKAINECHDSMIKHTTASVEEKLVSIVGHDNDFSEQEDDDFTAEGVVRPKRLQKIGHVTAVVKNAAAARTPKTNVTKPVAFAKTSQAATKVQTVKRTEGGRKK